MLVYKDIISGDELFSDSYPIKCIDDLYYEVEGKNISMSCDIDEALIGGNKAQEAESVEEDESVVSSAVQGINIVLTHKLVETGFTKDSFKDWLKTYMKELKKRLTEKNPARVDAFTKGMTVFAKEILTKFGDFRFYIGERMDPEGMIILMNYRKDNITPYFIFFKDGLEEEKF